MYAACLRQMPGRCTLEVVPGEGCLQVAVENRPAKPLLSSVSVNIAVQCSVRCPLAAEPRLLLPALVSRPQSTTARLSPKPPVNAGGSERCGSPASRRQSSEVAAAQDHYVAHHQAHWPSAPLRVLGGPGVFSRGALPTVSVKVGALGVISGAAVRDVRAEGESQDVAPDRLLADGAVVPPVGFTLSTVMVLVPPSVAPGR